MEPCGEGQIGRGWFSDSESDRRLILDILADRIQSGVFIWIGVLVQTDCGESEKSMSRGPCGSLGSRVDHAVEVLNDLVFDFTGPDGNCALQSCSLFSAE